MITEEQENEGIIELYGAICEVCKNDYIKFHLYAKHEFGYVWNDINDGRQINCFGARCMKRDKNRMGMIRNALDAIWFITRDPYNIHGQRSAKIVLEDWYMEAEQILYNEWLSKHKKKK